MNSKLTKKEIEVLAMISQGYNLTEIAWKLFNSYDTIDTHLKHIKEKIGIRDRGACAICAIKNGIIPMPENFNFKERR